MRSLKFRAWDANAKQIIFPSGVSINELCEEDFFPLTKPNTSFHCVIVWQQFTGLKDNNGKEIYEGDILTDNIVVDWCPISAGFCLNKKGCIFPHYFKEALDADKVEVIGNIYENPELLSG